MSRRDDDGTFGTPLPRIAASRKSGGERFHTLGVDGGFSLLEFWQWSASDLVSNATRGVLAEFIVAKALGISTDGVRTEWDAYDLETDSGIKVEVKSSGYIQSWSQERFSTISFGVKATRPWDATTSRMADEPMRTADVYVFAVLKHRDQPTLDPTDLAQWDFYVLPTSVLNARKRSQHSITLPSLRKLAAAVSFAELKGAVHQAATDVLRD